MFLLLFISNLSSVLPPCSEFVIKVFLIVDCPTNDHVSSLTTATQFERCYRESNNTVLVIHLLGDGVIDNENYKAWMKKFPAKTKVRRMAEWIYDYLILTTFLSSQHIISSAQFHAHEAVFSSFFGLQTCLNRIDSRMYPALYENKIPARSLSEGKPPHHVCTKTHLSKHIPVFILLQ